MKWLRVFAGVLAVRVSAALAPSDSGVLFFRVEPRA